MASIVTLDQQEFGTLMFLFGIREIPGFPELQTPVSGEVAETAARSLMEKGYLAEGEEEPSVSMELATMLRVLREQDGGFAVLKRDREKVLRHLAFYFSGEMILQLEARQEGEGYQMLGLPYLPLAVGSLAGQIGVFKNKETRLLLETGLDEADLEKELGIDQTLVEQMWIMTGWDRLGDEKECIFFLWEMADRQILFQMSGERVKVTEPDKADLVNACTWWMSKVHGQSMRDKGIA